jgi:4-amino-4-deoxy-L-arabinose transferase-like glycosyltransferase
MLKVVFVAISVGIVLRLTFLLFAPLDGDSTEGELSAYNDERAHFNYITYLLEHRCLPGVGGSIRDDSNGSAATYENYQPPLYYLVCAPAVSLWQTMDWPRSCLAARLVSLLAGIALLPIAYGIALAFGLSRSVAAGSMIVISILGSFVRFSSLVSNDTFCWLFAGLAIFFWLRAEHEPTRRLHPFLWCLFVSIGLYSKLSILLLVPLPILHSVLERNWKRSLKWLAWTIMAILFTLPIWIRNMQIFGSLFPLSAGFGMPGIESASLMSIIAYAVRSFIFPWQEFWGGWPGSLLLLVVILACVSLVIFSREQLKRLCNNRIFVLLLLMGIAGFAWLNLNYFQAEGRYLLISWPTWAIIIAGETKTIARQWILLGILLSPYLLFLFPLRELAHV